MVFHDYKSIFVHIPKTAGTSIEYSVRNVKNKPSNYKFRHAPDHRTVLQYIKTKDQHKNHNNYVSIGDFWSYHKFAVVRDPVEREVSLYDFIKTRGRTMKGVSFDEYLDIMINDENFKQKGQTSSFKVSPKNMLRDQIDFITSDGKILIDQIIRFEGLQNGFNLYADKVGLKDKWLPHLRKSKRNRTKVTTDQIKLIKEIRKKDYELLSY